MGLSGLALTTYHLVEAKVAYMGVLFGFSVLTILPIARLRSIADESAIMVAGIAGILSDLLLKTIRYIGSPSLMVGYVIVYSILFTLMSLMIVSKANRLHRLLAFTMAIIAWLVSSLGYYDGTLQSIFSNPSHCAIIATAIFLLFYDSSLIASLGAFSVLVAFSMDLSGYAQASLLGYDPLVWFTLATLPFLGLQVITRYEGLTLTEAYIIPIIVVPDAVSIIVGSQNISQLRQVSPYTWLVLPTIITIAAIVMTGFQRRAPFIYMLIGSILLALVAYSLGDYLGLQYSSLLALAVFIMAMLLSLDLKSVAMALLALMFILAASQAHITISKCSDTSTIQIVINNEVNRTTAKGSIIAIEAGHPYGTNSLIYMPLAIKASLCDSEINLQDNIKFSPTSYSTSILSKRVINFPDVTDITVYPSPTLWSQVISQNTLNRSISLDGRSYDMDVSITTYKGSFYNIFTTVLSVPISVLVYTLIEVGSLSNIKRKVGEQMTKLKAWSLFIMLLFMLALLPANPSLAQVNMINYKVVKSDNGIILNVYYNDTPVTTVSFKPNLYFGNPYDFEIGIYSLRPDTSLILEIEYICKNTRNTTVFYINQKRIIRMSYELPCPDYSKILINQTKLFVIHSPDDTSPNIISIDVTRYIREYNITNYFTKRFLDYWFSTTLTKLDYGWVNIAVRDKWRKVGDIEIVSHGTFNSTKVLKLLLQPTELYFWLNTTVEAILTPKDKAHPAIYSYLRPGEMLLLDYKNQQITKDIEYDLLVKIKSPTYEEVLNVTNTTGPIIFVENKTTTIELEPENVTIEETAGGWIKLEIILPLRINTPELSVNFTTVQGSPPLIMMAGLSSTESNSTTVTVYMASSSIIEGYLNLYVVKSENYVFVSKVPVNYESNVKTSLIPKSLQSQYIVIESNPKTIKEYPKARYGDYIIMLRTNETIRPNDFILITIMANITAKSPIRPIVFYPVITSNPMEISGLSLDSKILINSTNGGKTTWYKLPQKIILLVPGSYITHDPPYALSEYYFTLTLVFDNVENITVHNVTITKYRVVVQESQPGNQASLVGNYLYIVPLILLLSIILVGLRKYRSRLSSIPIPWIR